MATSTSAGAGSTTTFRTPWLTTGIVAIGAIVAGLLVPRLLPGEMVVVEKKQAKTKAEANGAKADYTPPALPDMPNPQGMLMRLAAGTAFVLGLSVVSIWGMRRWTQSKDMPASGMRTMRLVETLPLGQRCSLHLVHLGKREIVIGVDGGGIKTIVPLPNAFEDVLAETEPAEVVADASPIHRQVP
jgi:flagellar biogenesis protein FliO